MNSIAIEVVDATSEGSTAIQVAKISIDGLSLLELLKQHELPYAQKERTEYRRRLCVATRFCYDAGYLTWPQCRRRE
jgi:hypothetical protein